MTNARTPAVTAAVVLSMKHGLDHFVYRELSVMAEQGTRLILFPTKIAPGPYSAKPEWPVVRWRPLSVLFRQPLFAARYPARYFRLLRKAWRLRALADFAIAWVFAAKMRQVDVIYAIFGDRKLFIGCFCKAILGKPLVTTLHAYELYRNPNPMMFREALAGCDRIITVTEYNRELLRDRFGIDPTRVDLVRCTVDVEDYRPGRKFVLLIVGYFDGRKGHDVLFEAIKRLGMDDLEVWVVGERCDRGNAVDVRALARKIGIESQVAFFGELAGNALKAVYRACDVFCAPSRHDADGTAEGFPTVLMEAMAFGKPVITTRHVEIPRVVPAMIVEENDVAGLADAIRELRTSESARSEQGRANRKIAEALFSPRNARRTAEILAAAAERTREPGGGPSGK